MSERRLAAILSADVVGYSRLMGADEAGTLTRLKACRAEVLDPKIAEHRGRIFKTMGDGLLVEFASVVDAVNCAIAVQDAMATANAAAAAERRIVFRIGVNLGDVIAEDDDILGEGVNIAARLQAIAEPGGITISGDVHRQVEGKVAGAFVDLGERKLKNIAKSVRTFSVRAAGAQETPEAPEQEIRFCTASDGVQLAYATVGSGPPLVKAANWLNHLDYDWESPVWRHVFRELSADHRLIRYDARGNGLSDWDAEDVSFEALVRDLETVVNAAGLERFPLLGISQGCAVSIAYAARHPARVSRLVLLGGYAVGWRGRSAAQVELNRALLTLVKEGWGQDNAAFRQVFTTRFIPDATAEQMRWFNDLQKSTTSPENAVRIQEALGAIDVRDLLPMIEVPTLVLHCRDDAVVPFKSGRVLAASIPGARFVPLEGRNHLILENEPAWQKFLSETRRFLGA